MSRRVECGSGGRHGRDQTDEQPMNLAKIIEGLRQELTEIDQAIYSLERLHAFPSRWGRPTGTIDDRMAPVEKMRDDSSCAARRPSAMAQGVPRATQAKKKRRGAGA
jgi:hypothetical protein